MHDEIEERRCSVKEITKCFGESRTGQKAGVTGTKEEGEKFG